MSRISIVLFFIGMFNILEKRLLFKKIYQRALSTQMEHLIQKPFRLDVPQDTEFFTRAKLRKSDFGVCSSQG